MGSEDEEVRMLPLFGICGVGVVFIREGMELRDVRIDLGGGI